MRSERWGVTEMLHEWEPPIHFWLGARSRALSRIGRLDEFEPLGPENWDIQIKIRRWYTLTNNSFLRGFDLIYTILLSLFELGLSSERKASHDCIGIEMKIQDNNEIQEVLTSFETRNYGWTIHTYIDHWAHTTHFSLTTHPRGVGYTW